jgi:glutamyl-tRNA reductase
MLDFAVPRDVDPEAAEIPGVTLRNLDDFRDAVAPAAEQRGEIDRVRAIVAEQTPRFTAWQRAHNLAPLIGALQERAERLRAAELRRAAARLGGLSERERGAVEQLTRSMVAKLLHHPVTRVKAGAGTAEGEALARALRDLFELGES